MNDKVSASADAQEAKAGGNDAAAHVVVCPKCRKAVASVFELASHLWNEHADLPAHTLDLFIRRAARRVDAPAKIEQIGWEVVPLRRPVPGSIVTQAFIRCMSCGGAVSTTGGPRTYAMCLKCWPPQPESAAASLTTTERLEQSKQEPTP